jgi:hypothetical protein
MPPGGRFLGSQRGGDFTGKATNHYDRSINFKKGVDENCLHVDQSQEIIVIFGQAWNFLLGWQQSSRTFQYIWSAVKDDSNRDLRYLCFWKGRGRLRNQCLRI